MSYRDKPSGLRTHNEPWDEYATLAYCMTPAFSTTRTKWTRNGKRTGVKATGEKATRSQQRAMTHFELDRKSTRLNSSHSGESRMPSSA